MSAETGLDSWFLHEKLILGLLNQHEIAVLRHQLQLPSPDGYDVSIWPHYDGLIWPHPLVAVGAGMLVSA